MKFDKNFLIAGVALLTIAAASHAALAADIVDIPEPIVPEIIVEPADIGGWYIRGDIGYAGAKFKGADYTTPGCPEVGCDGPGTNHLFGKLKGSFLLGGGVGYQVTDYFRTDLTLDYMTRSKFRGHTVGTTCGNGEEFCKSDESGRLTALSLLANAYVDLGNFSGITPYVGAGIGGTRVKWGGLYDSVSKTSQGSAAEWRFTWALMAGLSYDLTESLKLDAGYRFRRVEGGKVFEGYGIGDGFDKSMDIHDVRVGLRYQFGGSGRQASYSDLNAPVYK